MEEEVVYGLYESLSVPHPSPYRCPVCDGSGVVPNGFYNQTSGQ